MAESGRGCRQQQQGPPGVYPAFNTPTIASQVTSCGPSRVSVLQLLLHSVAELLAAGVAAGDHVGSAEAGWI